MTDTHHKADVERGACLQAFEEWFMSPLKTGLGNQDNPYLGPMWHAWKAGWQAAIESRELLKVAEIVPHGGYTDDPWQLVTSKGYLRPQHVKAIYVQQAHWMPLSPLPKE